MIHRFNAKYLPTESHSMIARVILLECMGTNAIGIIWSLFKGDLVLAVNPLRATCFTFAILLIFDPSSECQYFEFRKLYFYVDKLNYVEC